MNSSTSASEPLRFLLKVLLFCSIPGAFLLASYVWGPHASPVDYMGGVALKHERLNGLGSPKMIIVGGSNATFGIDSERLETATCMPVVNMSIHASLGSRFMFREIEGRIGKGDLVLVALEHSGFSKADKENDLHVLTVDRFPEAINWMHCYDRPKVLLGMAVMRLQAVWKLISGAWKDTSPDPVYRADGFNTQGDLISHLDRPPRDASRQQPVEFHQPYVGRDFLDAAHRLIYEVDQADARIVFAWPCIAESSFRPEFHQAMEQAVHDLGQEFIGRTEDYVFPDSMFYDTHYHLNGTGRQLRTDRLVSDLCAWTDISCCTDGLRRSGTPR